MTPPPNLIPVWPEYGRLTFNDRQGEKRSMTGIFQLSKTGRAVLKADMRATPNWDRVCRADQVLRFTIIENQL